MWFFVLDFTLYMCVAKWRAPCKAAVVWLKGYPSKIFVIIKVMVAMFVKQLSGWALALRLNWICCNVPYTQYFEMH